MSNRAATTLAAAAVISSLCLYGASGQVPPPARGTLPVQHQQELPGRYQLSTVSSASGRWEFVVIDTHSGQCWLRTSQVGAWKDVGSPVEKDGN